MGWAGLIAPVQAYEAVVDARSNSAISDVLARDDFKHLRWIKTIELMLEHVPQLCLQTFVGIAHGDLVSLSADSTHDRLGFHRLVSHDENGAVRS